MLFFSSLSFARTYLHFLHTNTSILPYNGSNECTLIHFLIFFHLHIHIVCLQLLGHTLNQPIDESWRIVVTPFPNVFQKDIVDFCLLWTRRHTHTQTLAMTQLLNMKRKCSLLKFEYQNEYTYIMCVTFTQ